MYGRISHNPVSLMILGALFLSGFCVLLNGWGVSLGVHRFCSYS